MTNNHFSSKASFAELHLHLGGAFSPRMLWHKVQSEHSKELVPAYPTFPLFQAFFDKPRQSLAEYLEMHELVEPIQNLKRLDYFINRMLRGAFTFENLSYIEIRHCPYNRTEKGRDEDFRIRQMRKVVTRIHDSISRYTSINNEEFYPVIVRQILCLHAQSSPKVNKAILDLAVDMHKQNIVCAIDIAGGEGRYKGREAEIISYFKIAKKAGLKTTAHIYETEDTGPIFESLFEFVDRIGHGIQIPLKYPSLLAKLRDRDVCLEICPTTYFKCGTFSGHYDKNFKLIFKKCQDAGVNLVIGTDNSGFHNVRLQNEFENLLIHEVITFEQFEEYRRNGFKYAFGLTEVQKNSFLQG